MKKLAICVPTYKHVDVVKEILLYSNGYLKKHGVDIYYYDSSENDDLHRIIEQYNLSGVDSFGFFRVFIWRQD